MNKTIKERPDLVGKFGRAISKGVVACNANVRGCLQAFTALYPDRAPPPGDTTNVNRIIEQLEVRSKSLTMFRADEPKLWGAYSDKDWQATITGLHAGGQIESTDIKLDSLYTNQFVEEFNKFSADEVTREAKAYAPK